MQRVGKLAKLAELEGRIAADRRAQSGCTRERVPSATNGGARGVSVLRGSKFKAVSCNHSCNYPRRPCGKIESGAVLRADAMYSGRRISL